MSKERETPLHKQPVIYLSNLPYEACAYDLHSMFSDEDLPVVHVEFLKKGKRNRLKSAGLAAVTLPTDEIVQLSLEKLNGKELYGRPLTASRNKVE